MNAPHGHPTAAAPPTDTSAWVTWSPARISGNGGVTEPEPAVILPLSVLSQIGRPVPCRYAAGESCRACSVPDGLPDEIDAELRYLVLNMIIADSKAAPWSRGAA